MTEGLPNFVLVRVVRVDRLFGENLLNRQYFHKPVDDSRHHLEKC